MEQSESNFFFRAYAFANASAALEAIIGPSPWERRNEIGIIPGGGVQKRN